MNNTNKLDEYGGLMAYDFGATGFFRLEKRKRWWMVTPAGHAFLSFGVNHIHTNWMKCAYNFSFWDHKFKTAYPEDKDYFNTGILNKGNYIE